jgi:branched-chain amino acid transport system permease protein
MNFLQTFENVVQAAIAGLLTGSIYGLMCVGLALIFGVMRVINFAQGDFMMIGMYAAYYIFSLFGVQAVFGNSLGPYVAILLATGVSFVFGYFVHAVLISRVSGTKTIQLDGEGHYAQLILTLGIALIMTNGSQMIFGSVMAALRTPLTSAAWVRPISVMESRPCAVICPTPAPSAMWLSMAMAPPPIRRGSQE